MQTEHKQHSPSDSSTISYRRNVFSALATLIAFLTVAAAFILWIPRFINWSLAPKSNEEMGIVTQRK